MATPIIAPSGAPAWVGFISGSINVPIGNPHELQTVPDYPTGDVTTEDQVAMILLGTIISTGSTLAQNVTSVSGTVEQTKDAAEVFFSGLVEAFAGLE